MSRRPTRNCNARHKDPTGSSRAKSRDLIEVTPRTSIKKKGKRNAGTEPDYGLGSESSEPLKKFPKGSSRAKSRDLIEVTPRPSIKKKRKRNAGTEPDYGLGSESSEPLKKFPKALDMQQDGASAGRYPQDKPDVAVNLDAQTSPALDMQQDGASAGRYPQDKPDIAVNLDAQTSPETEKMDCSDDTNRERVSPDMDSESEEEAEGSQEPSEPSTRQTLSALDMQQDGASAGRYPQDKPDVAVNLDAQTSPALDMQQDGASAGRYPQDKPDIAVNLDAQTSPETEKMDCSDDTNRERVSPVGKRSKGNKDRTALPQNPADEALDMQQDGASAGRYPQDKPDVAVNLDAQTSPALDMQQDGASAGRYPQDKPDIAVNLDAQTSPETEKMDCSDDTNRERVSPVGKRSKGNKDRTALPQNPADEADSHQPLNDTDTNQSTHFVAPSTSADSHQSLSYKVPRYYTDTNQSAHFVGPSTSDYGIKHPTEKADSHQSLSYKVPRYNTDTNQRARFVGTSTSDYGIKHPTEKADSHKHLSYKVSRYNTDTNQSVHFFRPSTSDYGIKQPTETGSKLFFWKLAIPIVGLIAVLSACVFCLWTPEATALRALKERMELLMGKWNETQTMFPSQQQELWFRSKVLLNKHAGTTTVHTQPVILMFTAARDSEKTMRCLSSRIAGAYASAFNSTVVEIDGSSKKSMKSDDVKLDLDKQLSSAFSRGRKSAVIHHFQDLPPPSTLLFYKYCDHENAAFKDVSLVITVLLDKPTLEPDLPLSVVEEMVHDFLKKKFCSDEPGLFNDMDMDKLSGLWSRISHLVLPVRPEKNIEGQGCPV
ncbi:torsin-1A-interacting protein 1-like isoform X2 [Heptranchias perlo]|uniref:torsin-1A-interacting protein 1-like isoform X2 n=1 Tax=Heptranchias perlo TaxID=212740 RepID=UPI003559C148